MKRKAFITVLILVFVLLFSINSALAEEFSVRNGIHFGMTKDEVKAAEDGLPLSHRGGDYLSSLTEVDVLHGRPDSLAGVSIKDDYVKDLTIQYYFDTEEKLYKVLYVFEYDNENLSFTPYSTSKAALKQLDTLNSVLRKKYMKIDAAEERNDAEEGIIDFFPYAGEESYTFANIIRDHGSFYKLHNWSRYIVESDDGGVDVHLSCLSHFSNSTTYILIEYFYCSPSVFQNILEDYSRVAKEQDADL